MSVKIIAITNGKLYRGGDNVAWVEYFNGPLSDDISALGAASATQELVRVVGPEFEIQGKVTAISVDIGARFRVVRSDE